jgi:hypothetical protein
MEAGRAGAEIDGLLDELMMDADEEGGEELEDFS